MESGTASHTQSHGFGATCTDCKELGAEGSWIFFAMLGAIMLILVFKLFLFRKK